jgi:dipeptidyl aminopeptidase/acylaminoacyl peptidase
MKLRFSALSVLPLLASLATAQSSAPKPDPHISALLDNLGKTIAIGEVAMSPDATTVAYTRSVGQNMALELKPLAQTQMSGNTDRASSSITIELPQKGEAAKASADSNCTVSSLAWSLDSHSLASFTHCEGSDTQLVVQNAGHIVKQQKTTVLARLHGYASALRYTPDGKSLSFLYVENATRPAGALAAMKPPSGVIGVDNLEIQRIATVDLATGKLTQLTPTNLHVYEYDWSPDGNHLVYTAAAPPGENNWWIAQLYTQDVIPPGYVAAKNHLGAIWKPTKPEEQIAVPRWSPDGKQIAFIGGLMSDQGSTGGDIFLIPANGGPAEDLTPQSTISPTWLKWISATKLQFTAVADGESLISMLDLSQRPAVRHDDLSLAASIHADQDEMSLSLAGDKAVFIYSSFNEPPQVREQSLRVNERGATFATIANVNETLKPAWGKAESITWNNDGFKLQGWLLYPLNYDATKKYPLIVSVHGGPASAVLPHWPSVGFTPVAFSTPNPRGSYGEGAEFTAANRKDFGYGDLRDILTGLDTVEKSHNIDDHRIGITGWSYGGFMTMFAVTQTQRFKAAVAGAGISNWQSYYGENSIDQWMVPYFGATVYDDPDVYAKSSAINFIHHARTPTLVVVGDRDGECPAPQSFEFWHALRAQGTPTELVVYPDEGHHFASPEHQRDVLTRALQWFQQYMP